MTPLGYFIVGMIVGVFVGVFIGVTGHVAGKHGGRCRPAYTRVSLISSSSPAGLRLRRVGKGEEKSSVHYENFCV